MIKHQCSQLQNFIQRFKDEAPLYTLDLENLMAPYNYGEALSDFIKFMYDEELVTGKYFKILNEFTKAKSAKSFIYGLNEEDCLLLLTGFIRQDRFSDGFLAMEVKKGNVEAIIKRLKELVV